MKGKTVFTGLIIFLLFLLCIQVDAERIKRPIKIGEPVFINESNKAGKELSVSIEHSKFGLNSMSFIAYVKTKQDMHEIASLQYTGDSDKYTYLSMHILKEKTRQVRRFRIINETNSEEYNISEPYIDYVNVPLDDFLDLPAGKNRILLTVSKIPIITDDGFGNTGYLEFCYGNACFYDYRDDHSSWWNTSFDHRTCFNVTDTYEKTRVNERMDVYIDTASLIASNKMTASCDGILHDDTENTDITYYLTDCNTNSTLYRFNITMNAGAAHEICLYHDNETAANNSVSTYNSSWELINVLNGRMGRGGFLIESLDDTTTEVYIHSNDNLGGTSKQVEKCNISIGGTCSFAGGEYPGDDGGYYSACHELYYNDSGFTVGAYLGAYVRSNETYYFNLSSESWSSSTAIKDYPTRITSTSCCIDNVTNYVYCCGGTQNIPGDGSIREPRCNKYNGSVWINFANLTLPRALMSPVAFQDQRLCLLVGGHNTTYRQTISAIYMNNDTLVNDYGTAIGASDNVYMCALSDSARATCTQSENAGTNPGDIYFLYPNGTMVDTGEDFAYTSATGTWYGPNTPSGNLAGKFITLISNSPGYPTSLAVFQNPNAWFTFTATTTEDFITTTTSSTSTTSTSSTSTISTSTTTLSSYFTVRVLDFSSLLPVDAATVSVYQNNTLEWTGSTGVDGTVTATVLGDVVIFVNKAGYFTKQENETVSGGDTITMLLKNTSQFSVLTLCLENDNLTSWELCEFGGNCVTENDCLYMQERRDYMLFFKREAQVIGPNLQLREDFDILGTIRILLFILLLSMVFTLFVIWLEAKRRQRQ